MTTNPLSLLDEARADTRTAGQQSCNIARAISAHPAMRDEIVALVHAVMTYEIHATNAERRFGKRGIDIDRQVLTRHRLRVVPCRWCGEMGVRRDIAG